MKIAKVIFFFFYSLTVMASQIKGYHFVMVSDSHGNCAFGERMNELLRTVPESYTHSLAVGGSSPRTWLDSKKRIISPYGVEDKGATGTPMPQRRVVGKTQTPDFAIFLKNSFLINPQAHKLAIINLGTNSINEKELEEGALKMIHEVHAQGADCVWVSPPHMLGRSIQQQKKYFTAIANAVAQAGKGGKSQKECLLINSLEMTHYPDNLPVSNAVDKIHYCWHPDLLALGRQHAAQVFTKITLELDGSGN